MSEALYEQYKEALRRGHVAALRGRLEVAEAAYRAAAVIAPDRALPYASLGGVLHRQGRPAEALAAYGAALARAPEDEGALRGRAELHAEAGRRSEAAADHEVLSNVAERAGRLTDACDAARRALELAESRSRRRELERLEGLLRAPDADRSAVDALDRALRVLQAAEGPRKEEEGAEPAAAPDSAAAGPAGSVPEETHDGEPSAAPSPDPEVLRAAADGLLDAGDITGAAERYLALAAIHRAAGRLDAALDACLALLTVVPSDHRLQLAIAAIQADQGWGEAAAEKLRLLARLADLDGDEDARTAVAAFPPLPGIPAGGRAAGG
jgi:tetratricopeptide (TPR) repeat protein